MIFQDIQSMDENRSWHSTFQQLNIKARENAGSQKAGKSVANRVYNRYRDVVPYDHSLVQLRNSDTEYINANLVKVSSIDKKYILTQGPLANTCKHFWAMIWEQNTYSVVMLNRVIEKNQLKCHQYWPLAGSLTAGDIEITLKGEEDFHEFVVRDLELYHVEEEKTRSVKHFHYIAWPDFGVPRSPEAFLKFLFHVREYQSSIPGVGPPVIHCSAGIGRSGTFALIDAALTEIKQKDDMMDYDVKKTLLEMRTYRGGLIQTMEQLRFSYIAILEGANLVAPEAYGVAYWKMVNQEESEEEVDEGEVNEGEVKEEEIKEEEIKEDEPRLHEKRKEDEHEESEEPQIKVARKEETNEESSEGEDEIIDLEDVNDEIVNERTTAKSTNEDFHERVGDEPTTLSGPTREVVTEGDTDKGGTVTDRHVDTKQNENNESFVHDRDIRTPTSTTEDVSTDTIESRHEQFQDDSVEKVVGRWQSGDNEDDAVFDRDHEGEPRPKRSAMKTHLTEGKPKSVSFEENGDIDIDEETFETDERNRESSNLRRRQIEERKQKLTEKVDSIKKKMKEQDGGSSFFGKTMIAGLVICVVVAGVAFFYYRYQS